MTFWSAATRIFLFFMAVSLTACVSPTSPKNTGSGRYEMPEDSPVLEPIDLSEVQPVVPEPVERTAAGNQSPYTVNGDTYFVMPSEAGYEEVGIASWYGRKFHGHRTSDGEIYDMFSLSAAHKTLPIPSFLEVTNLDNGKSIVVRVNDRGPFHDDRVVDLSYAAASMLNFADKGTARVRVKAIVPGEQDQELLLTSNEDDSQDLDDIIRERELIEQDEGQEFLQVGAFSSMNSARAVLARVREYTSLPVFIRSDADANSGNLLHRVRLGPVNETIDLQGLIGILVDAGLGMPFKVRQ